MEDVRTIFFGNDEEQQTPNAKWLAEKGFPEGAELFCKQCQNIERLTVDDTAKILVNGIPQCCGVRMQMEPLTGLWV